MEIEEKKAAIEAILFAAGREVKVNEIMSSLEIGEEEAITILNSLASDFNEKKSGLKIIRMDDSYQLATKTDYHQYIYPIIDKRNKPNLSNAALETLAIIAYNQPVTRVRIEEIRGVGCDAMIRKLAAKALIKEVGREDTPGKPILYGVTDEFMDAFSLTSLDELPELKEMKEDFDQDDIFNTKYTESMEEGEQ